MTDERMRAAFEAWLNPGQHAGNVSAWVEPGRYEKDTHQLAWLAWRAATNQAAVPAGWKPVPMEPTPAMLQDGTTHCGMGMFGTDDEARKVYAAMLAAAPQPD